MFCLLLCSSEVECCDQTFSVVQQSSCLDEASGDLQDVDVEAEEIDVDEDVEDDDDVLEEVGDETVFMTEQILKFAGGDFNFSDKFYNLIIYQHSKITIECCFSRTTVKLA